jgi:hypothetical protein
MPGKPPGYSIYGESFEMFYFFYPASGDHLALRYAQPGFDLSICSKSFIGEHPVPSLRAAILPEIHHTNTTCNLNQNYVLLTGISGVPSFLALHPRFYF